MYFVTLNRETRSESPHLCGESILNGGFGLSHIIYRKNSGVYDNLQKRDLSESNVEFTNEGENQKSLRESESLSHPFLFVKKTNPVLLHCLPF